MPIEDHQAQDEHPDDVARSTRSGLWLFVIYAVIYGGFVGLAVFSASTLVQAPFGGVNLAIIYGIGLIVLALILALIYLFICRNSKTRGD